MTAIKRTFTLTLDYDLFLPFEQYVNDNSFQNASEAVRAIVRQHLAATPLDGAIQAAVFRAYNEARLWFYSELSKFLQEKGAELSQAIQPADRIIPTDGNPF